MTMLCEGTMRAIVSGLALVLLSGCQSGGLQMSSNVIKPAALKPGDLIGYVAPAGPLSKVRMERAKERLEARGYRVLVPDDVYRRRGYLAGTDEARAAELMAMFEDPNVAAIFPGTGGYGTTRMIDLLDYDIIRKNPKILIGFSDITGLHLAIHQRTGLVTFHSPNPMWGLGSTNYMHPLAEQYFFRALEAKEYKGAKSPGYVFEWTEEEFPSLETMSSGKARGRLIGGNLSLIAATMGTPYEIDTKGKILFFEDIDEAPYRIDRFLAQLKLAGKLDEAAGVLICDFNDCDAPEGRSLTLAQVLDDYLKDCGIPVVKFFPAGHLRQNVTLPVGALVELDADARVVKLLEDPVTLPESDKD